MTRRRGELRTADEVTLRYTDTGGDGIPLVLLHGWGQTSAMFHHQVDEFGASRRVIAYDMRGHGASDAPRHGYRIARLAADLRDVLDGLCVDRADLLGWSMGASVIWSYLELFGASRVRQLVFVDQPAAVVATPWMAPDEQEASGAILPVDGLTALVAQIHGDETGAVVRAFVRSMFSGHVPAPLWTFVAEEIARMPRHAAVPLLFDHATQDWRDILSRIDRPTLVLGADGSHVAAASQRYIASLIPESTLHVFPRDVASSHFPFLQNPEAFNQVLAGFLDSPVLPTSVG